MTKDDGVTLYITALDLPIAYVSPTDDPTKK
jgi:hypothetical protein